MDRLNELWSQNDRSLYFEQFLYHVHLNLMAAEVVVGQANRLKSLAKSRNPFRGIPGYEQFLNVWNARLKKSGISFTAEQLLALEIVDDQ